MSSGSNDKKASLSGEQLAGMLTMMAAMQSNPNGKGPKIKGFNQQGVQWDSPDGSMAKPNRVKIVTENEANDEGRKVQLYVYDLSNGLATVYSQSILGKHLDGVWHTSVVIDNAVGMEGKTEYVYANGVNHCGAGHTPFGLPVKVHDLGRTSASDADIEDLLASLKGSYSREAYDIVSKNCNHFSDSFLRALPGVSKYVPQDILDLPKIVMSSDLGPMIMPIVKNMQEKTATMYGDTFCVDPEVAAQTFKEVAQEERDEDQF
jgi:hypothetical protein